MLWLISVFKQFFEFWLVSLKQQDRSFFWNRKKFVSQQTCKGLCIYDVHMEERSGGEGVLKCVTYLHIFFVFKYLLFHFAGEGVGSHTIFANVTNVWPLNCLKLQPIQLLEAVVSCSTSSQIHFDCHSEHTTSNPQLPPPSNSLMTKLKDPLALNFSCEKNCGVMNIASRLPSNKTRSTRKYSRCSPYIFFA